MSEAHKIITAPEALKFVLGGRAHFTVRSLKTGEHLTFEVKAPKKPKYGISHFVSVRTGNDYGRLGMIRDNRFQPMRNADLPADSLEFRGFSFVLENLTANRYPKNSEIWHEGRCGMCARPLTHPDSIARGIGPECFQKLPKCEAA
jgi:hypothetical protein